MKIEKFHYDPNESIATISKWWWRKQRTYVGFKVWWMDTETGKDLSNLDRLRLCERFDLEKWKAKNSR